MIYYSLYETLGGFKFISLGYFRSRRLLGNSKLEPFDLLAQYKKAPSPSDLSAPNTISAYYSVKD